MRPHQFEYGPLAYGLLITCISLAPLIFVHWNGYFPWYLAFMAFLIFGLRPVLQFFRVVPWLESLNVGLVSRLERRSLEKLRRRIDRQARDRKYRNPRYKDDRLPPNW